MNNQLSKSDRIYMFQNGSYIKPIKLVYERPYKVIWDKDSCIIDFKLPVSGTYSFDDCTISLSESLFEKYYDADIDGKNIKSDASHFKSLL